MIPMSLVKSLVQMGVDEERVRILAGLAYVARNQPQYSRLLNQLVSLIENDAPDEATLVVMTRLVNTRPKVTEN